MVEKNKRKNRTQNNFILSRLWIMLESVLWIVIYFFVNETNGQTICGILGFYSTSGYTAVIFSAHLVTVKCEVFTTTSTWEIQLCIQPATQLKSPPLLPANSIRQSIAHARRVKWKGSITFMQCLKSGLGGGGGEPKGISEKSMISVSVN